MFISDKISCYQYHINAFCSNVFPFLAEYVSKLIFSSLVDLIIYKNVFLVIHYEIFC